MNDHDLFDDEKREEALFPDEQALKKENKKLLRQLNALREEQKKYIDKLLKQHEKALKNMDELYQSQLENSREMNRELIEKNIELKETSKIFVKGLEHLKQDGIKVKQNHHWGRKGVEGSLENRIDQLTKVTNKTLVAVCPLRVDSHGYVIEALIITEHFEKIKSHILNSH